MHTVATYVHDTVLTLLLRTACGVTGDPLQTFAPVLRFDFDITGNVPPTAFQAPTGTWAPRVEVSPGVLMPVSALVRDIVIDEAAQVAYVAVHTRGVYRILLDVVGTGLGYGDTDGWPIVPALESVAPGAT